MNFSYQEREYQTRLVKSTVGYFTEVDPKVGREVHSVMLLSPCGSGKTVTSMRIVDEMCAHGARKIVFIAHRERLLAQAREYVDLMGLGQKYPDLSFNAISIYEKDIADLKNPDLVIFDEAHHSACDSGVRLVGRLNPKKILGLTATNWRSDRIKLVFEKLVEDYGINALIEMGFLAKFDHYFIENWNTGTIVDTYLKNKSRFGKSIMYFHGREECEHAVRLLNEAGVSAESIYGSTQEHDREEIYARFEANTTTVLCNLILLTEGVDFPDVQSVFVKPSIKGLTIQMAGRALRIAPGKNHANIIQMAGDGYSFSRTANSRNTFRHSEGEWIQTQYSKEFIASLGAETLKYKLLLAKDKAAVASMQFTFNAKEQKGLEYITNYRQKLKDLPTLEELALISEDDL